MATFILILFGFALVHYMYESVIAPTIRLKLRFRLFELRDELRQLKIEKPTIVSDEVFEIVQQNLNGAIKLLPRTDFVLLRAFSDAVKSDQGLRSETERRLQLFEQCSSPDLRRIRTEAQSVFLWAFATNTLFILVMMVPLIVAVLPVSMFKRLIVGLLSVPADRVDEFEVDGYVAAF